MKKTLAFVLAVMLIASVSALPGCTKKVQGVTGGGGISGESQFPITPSKTTISIMVPDKTNITDITTNDFTKYYEGKTNIHVNWNVVPSANLIDKVNLSLSSGDLPDAYMDCNIALSQQSVYGSEGAFLDLTPYISKYSSLLTQAFKVVPNLKDDLVMANGKIYSLPYLEDNLHVMYPQKMWVNQDWLTKLKLPIPQTTDDFYNMLKAFKNGDPNGNGKKDEIPLTSSTDGWVSSVDGFIMNAFVFDDILNKRMYVNNGKVSVSYNQSAFHDGLVYLNKLYSEGLLDHEAFTQTTTQLQAKVENTSAETVGAVPGGGPTGFNISIANGRWSHLVAIPPLKGPGGLQVAVYNPLGTTNLTKFVITKASKNPAAVFRWAAEQYPVAMNQTRMFGAENVDWKKADAGKVDRAGNPAQVVINIDGLSWADKQNFSWRGLGVRLETPLMPANQYTQSLPGDTTTNDEFNLYKFTKANYVPYGEKPSELLPPLAYTADESATISDIGTVINSYVEQMIARFISGDANINTDWNSFVAQLDTKGLPKLLAAEQKAYDAKYKK